MTTEAILFQAAVVSVLNGPKHFNEVLKKVENG